MRSRELDFALTDALLQETEGILFPRNAAPFQEHGVIGILAPSSGRRRRSLLLHALVRPDPGDVIWDASEGLLFAPGYKSRAVDEANRIGAGVIFIHTHPLTMGGPAPSKDDLAADRRDLYYLGQAIDTDAPLAAAVVSSTRQWSVREYTFSFGDVHLAQNANAMTYASRMRIVGPGLRVVHLNEQELDGAADDPVDLRAHDSTIRLWGVTGQRALGMLRVGIPGLGGVGGILAEHVPRLGAGETVLMDFDRLSGENFNRSQGAQRGDVERCATKLEVAERLARESATARGFRAVGVFGSVVEATTLPDLLDCDIILNAADSGWARQVLDHLAFAHLVPVINGGTDLRGDPASQALVAGKCEVAVAGPGHPCFECAGVYTIREVTEAREDPAVRGARAYVRAGDHVPEETRSPSVISTNALVAGLMQLRLQALALGTTPATIVGTQRYHLLEGVLDVAPLVTCLPTCCRSATAALGDLHPLPLGVDLDFAASRAHSSPRPRP
jgi:hypothetical protein